VQNGGSIGAPGAFHRSVKVEEEEEGKDGTGIDDTFKYI
jgi:hypothetical protein